MNEAGNRLNEECTRPKGGDDRVHVQLRTGEDDGVNLLVLAQHPNKQPCKILVVKTFFLYVQEEIFIYIYLYTKKK